MGKVDNHPARVLLNSSNPKKSRIEAQKADGNHLIKCSDLLLSSDLSQCSDLEHFDSRGGRAPRERTLRCFSSNSCNCPQVLPLKGPAVIYLSDYTPGEEE